MTTTPNPPIIDGHNDTLLSLHLPRRGKGRSFFVQSDQGHLDFPRARAGGLGGGFFALFTPAKQWTEASQKDEKDEKDEEDEEENYPGGTQTEGKASYAFPLPDPIDQPYAQQFTIAMAARLFRLEAEAQGQVKVVRTVDELTRCLKDGTLAIIFHIEGAEAIDTNLDTLYVLYEAGLRSVGIVWSRANDFGYGVPFAFPQSPDTGPGLTDAGLALVRACNQLGLVVDLSHLNEKGFWDVAKTSEAPLVATHSGAYALCESARNLTDKQLDAIKESDGIVGVNFHVGFLRQDGLLAPDTSLTEIVRHVDYLAERIGIDRVALGSDFDGATMPGDLKDVAGLPKLMTALRDHGYDETALRKIAHENWVRVLRKTWRG